MRPTVLLVLLLTGCATIFKGVHQDLTIESDPPGMAVYANGVRIGTTPMRHHPRSDQDLTLEAKGDGYKPARMQLSHSVGGGWIAADFLLPGWVALILVDAVTGAWFYLSEDHVRFIMDATEESKSSSPSDSDSAEK